jgi:hypothetical protein
LRLLPARRSGLGQCGVCTVLVVDQAVRIEGDMLTPVAQVW